MRARRVSLLALALALALLVSSALAAPAPLGPEFPAEDRPVPEESWWSTCVDGAGIRSTIVPACVGEDCPDTDDLYLERRDPTGALASAPLKLNEAIAARYLFRLSCHPAGWVVAQWRDQDSTCFVHRLIAPDGEPVSLAILTAPPGHECRNRASLAVRSGGTFVGAWATAGLAGGSTVVVQAYGADAEIAGEPLILSDTEVEWNRLPKIAVDDDDHALIAWSGDSHDIGPSPVYAQFLDTTAAPIGEIMRLDSFAYGKNSPPAITYDGHDVFTVTWSNPILGGRIARHVGLSGTVAMTDSADPVGSPMLGLPHFGAERTVDSREVTFFDLDARLTTLVPAGDSTWILRNDDGVVQQSLDNGITWSPPGPPEAGTLAVGARPNGHAIALSNNDAHDRMDAVRSRDGGATWSDPSKIATIAADPVACTNCRVVRAAVEGTDDDVWVAAWAVKDRVRTTKQSPWRRVQRIVIVRSFDGGKIWGPVATIDAQPGVGENGFDLHTDGAGEWILAWMDEDLHIMRSDDDARHWSQPIDLATDVACVDCGVARRAPRVEISDDGAGTWLMVFAAARYRTSTFGYDGDVFVSRSTDGGLNWTDPAPLAIYASSDASREIDPTVATNGDGRWVAVWTSHRPLGPTDLADPDLVMSLSIDGGATWSPPISARAEVDALALDGSALLAVDANGVWLSAWHSVPYDDTDGYSTESIFAAAADAECGNDIVEPGEGCDEPDSKNGDGCDVNCTMTACGNGVVTRREECDDGNGRDDDACLSDCRAARCGDGLVNGPDEECDDGNDSNEDECPTSCRLARCGDGELDPFVEECDDGNADNSDACVGECKPARCGDGYVQARVEACDDGNDVDDDACANTCDNHVCGDGFTSIGFESCDPADPVYGEVCTEDCRLIDLCGDADGDGAVSVLDAQRILLRGVGLSVRCPREACDMDSSGAVRVGDAQIGVAAAVGLEVGARCSIGTGNIVFWIDHVGDIGSVQIEVDYSQTGGDFVGSAGTVACVPVLEGMVSTPPGDEEAPPASAFAAFNDVEADRVLHAAFVSAYGFSGPIDLFRCAFVMPEDRHSARFEIKTIDAADGEFNDLLPYPLFGYRLE